MKIKLIFTVLLVALITAGCTSTPQQPAAAPVEAQLQSLAASMEQISPEHTNPESGITQVANGEYPSSPEGVVQAFLASYSGNPSESLAFLSSGAQANLNSESFAAVMQFGGAIQGFTIDQAAVNPDIGAFIGVAIQAAGSETRRDFTLTIENGLWKIEVISTPAG
jgi:hypothetical protein